MHLRPVLAFLAAFALAMHAAAQTPPTHEHGFAGAEHWSHVFDDPARDEWQRPHDVIRAMSAPPGARIADIGAGTGYFSIRLARMVPGSRVYAVDIEPDMVKYVTQRAKREKAANVRAVLATPDDARLPEKVDRVLVVDTYHHIGDRVAYFKRLASYLKPGGEVAIVDFTKSSPMGPPVEERIEPAQVKEEMAQAGYRVVHSPTFLPHQYMIVFAR